MRLFVKVGGYRVIVSLVCVLEAFEPIDSVNNNNTKRL
jgi:hypothetical protein